MPKFAANLSFLFTDAPFEARFRRAAGAGFQGVEYLFPYDWPAHDVAEWLKAADVEQVLFNLPPGDWAAGERGLACLPHALVHMGPGGYEQSPRWTSAARSPT